MIQTIVTHTCPKYGSENLVRNGHDYKGAQKYHCQSCSSYGALHAQLGYDARTRKQVLQVVYALHPERFVRGLPHAALPPEAVWINKPSDSSDGRVAP